MTALPCGTKTWLRLLPGGVGLLAGLVPVSVRVKFADPVNVAAVSVPASRTTVAADNADAGTPPWSGVELGSPADVRFPLGAALAGLPDFVQPGSDISHGELVESLGAQARHDVEPGEGFIGPATLGTFVATVRSWPVL